MSKPEEQAFVGDMRSTEDTMARAKTEKAKTRKWIGFAFLTAILFTSCNQLINKCTEEVGINALFYFSPGCIFASLVFNIIEFTRHYRQTGKLWVDQNIIVNGRLIPRNLLAFTCYCCLYFLI